MVRALRIRPQNFFALNLALWLYAELAHAALARIELPSLPMWLLSAIALALGLALGRVYVPAVVVLSIVMRFYTVSALMIAAVYVFAFLGYVMSPIHPCVAVTAEYFSVSEASLLRSLLKPVLLLLVASSAYFSLLALAT